MCLHNTLYHSRIFKTITDELGEKKFSINSGLEGLFDNLFTKKPIISIEDINSLKAYNAEIEKGTSPITAYYKTLQNASDAATNMAYSAGKSVVNLNNIPKASNAATVGLKALSMAGNMVVFALISKGISLAVTAIDNYIHRIDNAKEKLNDSVSSFESVSDEVHDLETQLEECQNRITELQQKANEGTISLIEEKELEKLKETNDELERKAALDKTKQIHKQKDVLEKNDKVLHQTLTSKYALEDRFVGGVQPYQRVRKTVTVPEELGYALNEHDHLKSRHQNGDITQKEYEKKLNRLKRILKNIMIPSINPLMHMTK